MSNAPNGNAAPGKEGGAMRENTTRVSTTGDLSKVRVSCFANAHATDPEGTGATLLQIVADICGEGRRGQELAQATAKVRRLLAEANGDKRNAAVDAAKKALPCFTASGRFPKRAKKNLTQHTGIIQADFDHVPDIPKLKEWLAADPHVVVAQESVSGTGVKALFRVQPPDTDDPAVLTAWHEKSAFPALTAYCQRAFGFRIDQQCGNVDRLYFAAHDPDVVTNWNAEPLDVEAWLNAPNGKTALKEKATTATRVDAKNGATTGGSAPAPVIRNADDVKRAKALAKSKNKQDFRNWALDRGFRGDLRTLDLRKLLVDADLADDPGDDEQDEDKFFVRCPWANQHTTGGNGTDVVVLRDPDATGFAHTFHCSHDHCADKNVMSLLDWCEDRTPGCVDEACAKTYEAEATDPSFNDAGRADRFVARFGRDVRFVPSREVWLTWEQDRWRVDADGAMERLAVTMSKEMLAAAAKIPGTDEAAAKRRATASKEALACGDVHNIKDFLALARVNPRVLLPVDKLDADPWVVGGKNWVIDLRTGQSRAYTREDFITRTLACDVDPNVTCPRWEKFMEEVFPDPEVRRYVWKACGYCLTGIISEHVFFFLYGVGRNGKSTLVGTLEKEVFGQLAVRAGRGVVVAPKNGRQPNDEVAELAGARVILTSEVQENEHLNEGLVKDLTGGDKLRGRFLYERGFEFEPVGKLFIVGNHRPVIRGTDEGVWRRVRLIGFNERFDGDKCDRTLPDKLKAEAPGILNWLIRGCLLWQKEGLEMPEAIASAVEDYRNDEDRLADFIDERTTEDFLSDGVKHADVYTAYKSHAEATGNRYPLTSRKLVQALRDRKWRDKRTSEAKVVWQGVRLVR